jgi:hypothetical protein
MRNLLNIHTRCLHIHVHRFAPRPRGYYLESNA